MLEIGDKTIGLNTGLDDQPGLPPDMSGRNEAEQIEYLLGRFQELQVLVEGKADSSKLKTLIAFSDEDILIQAKNIALVGDVTIAQIVNEQNGTTNGLVDISITRIIGDRIKTGSITSNNWSTTEGTAIDLTNNKIWMGGSSSPKLYYDGAGNLSISGTLAAASVIANSVTIDGVTIGTVKSNASTGATHAGTGGNPHGTNLSQIAGDLDDISDGSSYFRSTAVENAGGSRAYNALDSSYDYIRAISTTKIVVSGSNPTNGVIFDSAGLRGYSGGVQKFNIDTSGNASFAGDISAATGTFSGGLNTSGIIYATGGTDIFGVNAAINVAPANGAHTGIYSTVTSGIALEGRCTSGVGVLGFTNSGYAGSFSAASGGTALRALTAFGATTAIEVSGGGDVVFGSSKITKTRVNGQTVSVYDTTTHALVATYEYSFEG